MHNMLIRPTAKELEEFGTPDFTIYNAGQFPANRFTAGMTSQTSVEVNFKRREMVILGTEYAGEMKKGIFSVMHYLQPVKFGNLSLHSSANQGPDGDVSLFFGLSGTGKTTLSADPSRALIGDDEHVWSDTGVFNIEGGWCVSRSLPLDVGGGETDLVVLLVPQLRQVCRPRRREGAGHLQRHPLRLDPRERHVRLPDARAQLRGHGHHREHALRLPDRGAPPLPPSLLPLLRSR